MALSVAWDDPRVVLGLVYAASKIQRGPLAFIHCASYLGAVGIGIAMDLP